jgi:cell division protein FtsI/penicillin-binding protein 2
MPLASLNALAQERGYGFRTDAATYPLDVRRAHVTNYRDQHLDRRAQDGRFGLAQAITYSLNTWFAWSGELSDATLLGRPDGGMPMLQALDPHALGLVRPIAGMARLLGFGQPFRLDGGLLPADFPWSRWDALQTTAAQIDPIRSRHELRQMAIGLRMQSTPLQMALVAGAVGQGRVIAPRLLLGLDGQTASVPSTPRLAVRLDRIRAGMQGVVDHGTAAGAFRAPILAPVRARLAGKTGTSPTVALEPDGARHDVATVWFSGWLEPGALPGQQHRLAVAAFASHSDATGGEHAAPMAAALFAGLLQNAEQKAKAPLSARLGG